MLTIIDYGAGNIRSILKALRQYTTNIRVESEGAGIRSAEKLVLPGVGAFGDSVDALHERELFGPISEVVASGIPILGVCLGMQLLGKTSEEAPGKSGFGFLDFHVKCFDAKPKLKVPHVGWNSISKSSEMKLLQGVHDGADFYFVHSYHVDPSTIDNSISTARCNYSYWFPCALEYKNIYGVQFHPEKSQAAGLKVIKNFIDLKGSGRC